ncbi:MAG TPA: hypothetical protein VK137_03045 [Planctomycetaceae bacterium]|nr:hypothetical protein [Planctomycetaceae bacterium]
MTSETPSSQDERLAEYLRRYQATLGDGLGFGVHGSVFVVQRQREDGLVRSAVKFHEHWEPYCHERDVYLRLRDVGVFEVCGHAVPELLHYDDELWVLEMTIVKRPFVLDFGGAYLDRRPDYPKSVMRRWRAEKRWQFGANWPKAQVILFALEQHGIYVADVNPGNIGFVDRADSE